MPDDPVTESAAALRAKAEYCMAIAKWMSEETRTRLIQLATKYLERAVKLEQSSGNNSQAAGDGHDSR